MAFPVLFALAVKLVVFENLQCSDCAVFDRMLREKLLPKYGGRITVEHRAFPLAKHAWARPAAIAAKYFDQLRPELGDAWRAHCYARQKRITAAAFAAEVKAFAARHKADPAAAVAALDDPGLRDLVEKDYQDGVARGVARTPTVFVDGRPFVETFTVEEISKGIDQALAETR